ncbi:MAG: hypothetical protein DA408_13480 [Bacteroidetes bacterium]|nr:MAG: hypothetical protein DA408_13480 [Bacteroidota bacterium]
MPWLLFFNGIFFYYLFRSINSTIMSFPSIVPGFVWLAVCLGLCLPLSSQVMLHESERQENHFKFEKVDHETTDWWQEHHQPRPNVWRAERLFNAYFAAHPREKSLQKKLFIRWLQDARLSVSPTGEYLPHQARVSAVNSTGARTVTGTWSAIGPNYAERTTCGTTSSLTGGFCDRVYINPYNTNNLFAGYSYGGLWVSQNQGQTWTLTDAEFANGTNTYANRDYYYGDIEASQLNPDLVFAATEAGLLKSADGGQHWAMCPQLNRTAQPNTRPYYLALSQATVDVALATFGRQVFRSTDGGTTWSLVFDHANGGPNHTYTSQYNNNSTFGIYQRNYNFFGLEADHNDPSVFYLGGFNANDEPCVYKSTDGGASFALLVNLPAATGVNWPGSLHLRTIPAQPDRFYVFGQFANGNMYRFNEDGTLAGENLLNAYVEAGDVNWLDENSVYAGFYGASSILKSANGGRDFTDMTSGYGGCPKYVHPDVRDIDVVGDMVLIGSDGGIALSTDAMENVYSVGREISSIDLWGFSSSAHSDILSAGCDHGPTKIRRYAGDNGWISRGGGDAGQTSVNQSNDRWIYFDHGYGIFKTELAADHSFLSTEAINPGISLHRVAFHPHFYQTAYGIAGTRVAITEDNFTSFQTFYDFNETVNRILISPTDPQVFYVLLTNRKIRKSVDGGASWTTITPAAAAAAGQTNITDIAVGDDPAHLWAAYGNWQTAAKILQSTDGGATWVNITSPNLPTTPVNQLVYQRGTDGGIYLAFNGQSGVYYRNNTMPRFEPLGEGLPMLGYVQNIYAVPGRGKYRMGSSRGAWEHEVYEPSTRPVAGFAVSSNTNRCHLTPISFFQNSMHSAGPVTYQWAFPGGTPATSTAANPLVSYAELGEYDVSLTITDEFGTTATTTRTNFITVEPSICRPDELADKNVDLPVGNTNRLALNQVPIHSAEFTITAWVQLHELQKSFSQIVSYQTDNDNRFGLGFAFMGYTPNTNLVFTSPDVPYGMTSTINLGINAWHYLAITYSSTEVKIYLDGQAPWVRTGNFRPLDFTLAPFFINSDIHNQGGNFHGEIDELAFYDRVLTQEEIREKRHLVKNLDQEDRLVTYYQFNQYDPATSTLYELVSGHPSVVLNSLVSDHSPIPVAGGAVVRIPGVGSGAYDFSGADVLLDFPAGSAPPQGEVVVTRLDGMLNQSPPDVAALSASYWVVNNYGTVATNLDATVTLLGSGIVNSGSNTVYTLHQRPANATAAWTETQPGNAAANDGVAFAHVTDLGQLLLSANTVTSTAVPGAGVEQSLVTLSPNPARDYLDVLFAATARGGYRCVVVDALGQVVFQEQLNGAAGIRHRLNLRGIPKGSYFLVLKGATGALESHKFVVE